MPQVVDQRLGVNLLLDVEGRGVDDEIGPVLLVLAAPDELRVEVTVTLPLFILQSRDAALAGHAHRRLLFCVSASTDLVALAISSSPCSPASRLDATPRRKHHDSIPSAVVMP